MKGRKLGLDQVRLARICLLCGADSSSLWVPRSCLIDHSLLILSLLLPLSSFSFACASYSFHSSLDLFCTKPPSHNRAPSWKWALYKLRRSLSPCCCCSSAAQALHWCLLPPSQTRCVGCELAVITLPSLLLCLITQATSVNSARSCDAFQWLTTLPRLFFLPVLSRWAASCGCSLKYAKSTTPC